VRAGGLVEPNLRSGTVAARLGKTGMTNGRRIMNFTRTIIVKGEKGEDPGPGYRENYGRRMREWKYGTFLCSPPLHSLDFQLRMGWLCCFPVSSAGTRADRDMERAVMEGALLCHGPIRQAPSACLRGTSSSTTETTVHGLPGIRTSLKLSLN